MKNSLSDIATNARDVAARTTIGARIENLDAQGSAEIRRSSDQRPKMSLRLVLDLTTARTPENPMLISQPFNGYYVVDSSDAATNVRLAYGGIDKYATDNYTELKKNDSAFSTDLVKQATLTWKEQAGKTLIIIFYLGVDFRPGSLLSSISGGVAISQGSSVDSAKLGAASNAASVAVGSGAVVQILAANLSRKQVTLYFDIDCWIGDGSVNPLTRGQLVPGGSTIQFQNTGTLFGRTATGTCTVTGNEEA